VWSWLLKFELEFIKQSRLIHIAPEACLKAVLSRIAKEYFAPEWDLRKIPFPDASVNMILHNHVMEHILEDEVAFREQARILTPGGTLFLTVPFGGERTRESTTGREGPKVRRKQFGQHDHWRVYGLLDIVDRIKKCGFTEVAVIDATAQLPESDVARTSLDRYLVRAEIGS